MRGTLLIVGAVLFAVFVIYPLFPKSAGKTIHPLTADQMVEDTKKARADIKKKCPNIEEYDRLDIAIIKIAQCMEAREKLVVQENAQAIIDNMIVAERFQIRRKNMTYYFTKTVAVEEPFQEPGVAEIVNGEKL